MRGNLLYEGGERSGEDLGKSQNCYDYERVSCNPWRSERDSNCRYVLLPGVFTSVDGSAKSPSSVASYVRGAVALVGRDRDCRDHQR